MSSNLCAGNRLGKSMVLKFRKAQSAIEFVILVTAVLFLFVGMLVLIQQKIAASKYESASIAAEEIAKTIQEEINLADGSTDGYSRQFIIPETINGLNYNASIVAGSIYIRTTDGKHAIALPVGNVSGDVVLGVNSITKFNNSIRLNS